MYPNLYYAFKDLLGVEWPALRFVNSFGFFVAWAFLAAAYVLTQELRRKQRAGLLRAEETKVVVGKPASTRELVTNFILGFLLGYKILGLFFLDKSVTADPQEFVFSSQGSWPAGIFLGILFAGLKWYEKNRRKLAKPEERIIRIWPHDRVGDMVILAAVFGFLGAKIFHNLENWNEFWKNPIDALFLLADLRSTEGSSAQDCQYIFLPKHKIGFRHLCDSFAPALMLAYAVGRIGCQVSGDGDWGILNSAYISAPSGEIHSSDTTKFNTRLFNEFEYYRTLGYEKNMDVEHKSFVAPSWMPVWMVAYNYPHNVISEGIPIKGCEGDQYCDQLPIPVFPTPFYETVICLILTGILLMLRNKLKVPGTIFAVYLVLNGVERFFIEKIRVNTKYNIFGFHPTQAELISFSLIIAGVILFFVLQRSAKKAVNV